MEIRIGLEKQQLFRDNWQHSGKERLAAQVTLPQG